MDAEAHTVCGRSGCLNNEASFFYPRTGRFRTGDQATCALPQPWLSLQPRSLFCPRKRQRSPQAVSPAGTLQANYIYIYLNCRSVGTGNVKIKRVPGTGWMMHLRGVFGLAPLENRCPTPLRLSPPFRHHFSGRLPNCRPRHSEYHVGSAEKRIPTTS